MTQKSDITKLENGKVDREYLMKMLKNGTDPHLSDEQKCTPFHLLNENESTNEEMVELMLEKGAGPILQMKTNAFPFISCVSKNQ